MFTSRKLRQLRREIKDFAPRARHRLARHAKLQNSEALAELETLEEQVESNEYRSLTKRYLACRHAVDRQLPLHQKFKVREAISTVVIAFLLAMVLRAEIVQASHVPSGSMLPTIVNGDQLLVNKVIYGLALPFTEKKIPFGSPRRGDIIVFKNPGEPSVDFVKRLVGLPGDTIRLRGMDLFINGLPVERRLIGETRTEDGMGELYWEKLGEAEHRVIYHPRRAPHQNYDPRLATRYDFCRLDEGYLECIIPEGQYFFMGDNRDNSNDSRFWGFVPESHLRGKASLVHFAWPPSQWRERIGTVLR